MSDGITSATEFLGGAVKSYLALNYNGPPIKENTEIDPVLSWVPTLNCKINTHLMIVEASEKVYPAIFRMRRAEMAEVEVPIAVYCVCPEEAYLSDQKEAQNLAKHGFGLFTVNVAGEVIKKFSAIPIAQHITDTDYSSDVKKLPIKIKRRTQDSFSLYKENGSAGVASISELVEGMIMKAAKEAAKKGWISNKKASGALATVLEEMRVVKEFQNTRSSLSGAQAFVARYRNANHHFPKNQKMAYRKYRDCRHGFLDGIRTLQDLHDAMKSVGLSGSI